MSTQATLPLYLRKYDISIALPGSTIRLASDEFEPESLRVTFEIEQRAFQVFWWAEINVWNLAENTVSDIMRAVQWQQIEVTVQAGYKSSPNGFGIIWQGPVFQTLFNREGVVDTVLTLHCVLGLGDISRNFVNQTFVAGITQAELATKIAAQAFSKIPVARLSDKIKSDPLPRGRTVFGSPSKYFGSIAQDSNLQWWLDSKGLTMSGMTDDDIPTAASLTFTPPSLPVQFSVGGNPPAAGDGIIVGTPQQTPYGVAFRALIDSRVQVSKPFVAVKVDNSQIRRLKQFINPGGSPQISILDQDGVYVVAGVRFTGDTRGNAWYMDIDGYTTVQAKIELMQAAAYNTNGG